MFGGLPWANNQIDLNNAGQKSDHRTVLHLFHLHFLLNTKFDGNIVSLSFKFYRRCHFTDDVGNELLINKNNSNWVLDNHQYKASVESCFDVMFTLLLLLQMWVNKKCISFDSFHLLFILAVMLTGFILNKVEPPYKTFCYSTASNIAGYGMCMTNTDQTTNSQSTPHTPPLRIIDLCNIDDHDIKSYAFKNNLKRILKKGTASALGGHIRSLTCCESPDAMPPNRLVSPNKSYPQAPGHSLKNMRYGGI